MWLVYVCIRHVEIYRLNARNRIHFRVDKINLQIIVLFACDLQNDRHEFNDCKSHVKLFTHGEGQKDKNQDRIRSNRIHWYAPELVPNKCVFSQFLVTELV